MLFKYKGKFVIKTIILILCIYMISSIFIVSFAENYEWTVINSFDAIETNSSDTSEIAESTNKSENIATDNLNLECESAILIEQISGQILYEKNGFSIFS